MSTLRSKFNLIVLAIVLAILSGCSTFGGSNFNNGYYTTVLNQSFGSVYKASLEALENGQTYDLNGSPYDIKINKKMENEAVIAAESDNTPSDFVEIAIEKKAKDKTQISIKYGSEGNAIRSSALVSLIQNNINHH
ncbi:DUF3568 family protein [Francisella sp. LA112445]|jgi:hypothetical protein|uniref:DUF3568 family protein n=1 Tax=Francisella sp. LA112445 TaxID=1395624 RepID=UPI001788DD22|nr:DUF3568 family protein [Francisella sp. LA112445]QIW10611.1 DUF3568 family protein [Francisella sp. LA112445]